MPLATIALGANLPSPVGPPDATLAAAVDRLSDFGRVSTGSSLYSTTPIGLIDQPRFFNAVLTLETLLSPLELLGELLEIEQEFGRDRPAGVSKGPRTLDLDLVLYGDLVLNLAGLEIPHPRFHQRAFVLMPLAEIAPQFRDPRTGGHVSELLQAHRSASPQTSIDATDTVVKIQSDRWCAALTRAIAVPAPLRPGSDAGVNPAPPAGPTRDPATRAVPNLYRR